jgi:hypothetical protein
VLLLCTLRESVPGICIARVSTCGGYPQSLSAA